MKHLKSLTILLISLAVNVYAQEEHHDKADSLFTLWDSSSGMQKTHLSNEIMVEFYNENDIDTLITFNKNHSDLQQDAYVLTYMTNHLYFSHSFESAYTMGLRALVECGRYSDVTLLSECLNTLGVICQRKGLFEQAISYMERVYKIDRAKNDKCGLSTTMNNLATLYLGAGDPETALSYVLPAINYEREIGDDSRLAVRLALASDIWLALGHPQNSLPLINEALALDENGGRGIKAAVRRSQKAPVLLAMGKTTQARACIDSAIVTLSPTKNHISLAICYNVLGNIENAEHNTTKAIQAYKNAENISSNSGGDFIRKKAVRGLADTYKISGEEKAALAYLEEYVKLSEKTDKDKSKMAVENFKIQYQTTEKEKQLATERERAHARLLLLLIISAFSILLGMGIVILSRLLHIKKCQAEILYKNYEAKSRLLSIVPAISGKEEIKVINEVIDTLEDGDSVPQLTKRELEVVRLCCEGLQSKEIADRMNVSVRTIDAHKANIFRKLKINNTVELVKYAAQTGLLK